MQKQKINKIIILSVVIFILSITCFFANTINNLISKFLNKNLNIVEIENNLVVHFIDVGPGDAVAINLPNDEVLLIDTGAEFKNVQYTNYLKEKVLNFKKDFVIDYLILTHADSDHIGGAVKLLQTFNVEKVYMPILKGESEIFEETFGYIENNCEYEIISTKTKFNIADCIIEILGLYETVNTNTSSTIVKVSYLNKSFLFMADADFKTEEFLINEYGVKLDCDVLKVAHHGSKYSTSEDFLNAVSPQYAVISVGMNSYGHPNQIVLDNLSNVGSIVYRTDLNGDVLFAVSELSGLTCHTGGYLTINKFIDYKILVLTIDIVLLGNVVIVLLKKTKKKTKL